MTIMRTTDDSFEVDVLKADVPVVVDFWAEWCGPCKVIAPHLEELANDKGEQIRIAKVNIDDNPLTPTKYGVRGIPTLMLFKDGELAATKVGAMQKSKLFEWVDEAL
jgi:thioredoxin 1